VVEPGITNDQQLEAASFFDDPERLPTLPPYFQMVSVHGWPPTPSVAFALFVLGGMSTLS
jgi:hypothetical protein